MSSAEPAVRLNRAAFGYAGRPQVEDLTLDIPAGAAVALIGPNGSGKSTLLKGLVGLTDLVSGEARVLGEAPGVARRRIGVLPQSDTRDTTLPLTLRQVVTMGLFGTVGLLGRIGRNGRARVTDAIASVGLSEQADELFGRLSGGQQQRGILARALVSQPKLLLLDEPFNGLDRDNRDMLLELVRRQRDEDRTVLVSTHDLEIARESCTHVLLLSSGHHPSQPGHPAAFGPLDEALTLEAVQHAFHEATVEIDEHTVTTTREVDAP